MFHHPELLNLLRHYTLLTMFIFMCVENLGVPFVPIEIGYVVAQNLIAKGQISYAVALLVFTLAHIIGSLIAYFLGEKIHDRLIKRSEFRSITKRVEGWYAKYGSFTVFLTRFIGQIRPFSSYIAGIAEMPFVPFLMYTALGALIFNVGALALTKYGLHLWSQFPAIRVLALLIYIGGFIWFVLAVTHEAKKDKVE